MWQSARDTLCCCYPFTSGSCDQAILPAACATNSFGVQTVVYITTIILLLLHIHVDFTLLVSLQVRRSLFFNLLSLFSSISRGADFAVSTTECRYRHDDIADSPFKGSCQSIRSSAFTTILLRLNSTTCDPTCFSLLSFEPIYPINRQYCNTNGYNGGHWYRAGSVDELCGRDTG